MTSIHISDVRAFRSCRRKWEWSSGLKENLEPIIPYAPFFTGRAVHDSLEQYYLKGTPLLKALDIYLAGEKEIIDTLELWPAEQEVLDEQIVLIEQVLEHYEMWQKQDHTKYSDENLEYIDMEIPFEIPMLNPQGNPVKDMTYGGRFDGLVRHKKTGEYWIWEAKTSRSISELVKSLANDEQSALYLHAAEIHYNKPIAGVLYNIMRKKAPSLPKALKTGGFSKAKSTDTTSYYYRWMLQQEYPDWDDETINEMYGDILERLKEEKDPKFFMRFPLRKSRKILDMVLDGLYYTALEMVDESTKLYPAPGWLTCNFCLFKSACLTMNDGGDYRALLDGEFQQRKSATSQRNKSKE